MGNFVFTDIFGVKTILETTIRLCACPVACVRLHIYKLGLIIIGFLFVQFRKYSLLRILNVEENHDQGTGDRYLVEMELKEISSGKSVRFSEYVYRPWGAQTLCSPVGVAWNKSAVINILLTTGNNQGRWILHFLDNMAKIYNRTKDFNVNVVIADFGSKDINIENALKKAAIPSYQYANIKDTFSRALGLQLAAKMVRDPNSIMFAMDLHLDIPYHFLDDVRKVCKHACSIYPDVYSGNLILCSL